MSDFPVEAGAVAPAARELRDALKRRARDLRARSCMLANAAAAHGPTEAGAVAAAVAAGLEGQADVLDRAVGDAWRHVFGARS